MGSCQNQGPFLGTLNSRCRIKIGIQRRTIILKLDGQEALLPRETGGSSRGRSQPCRLSGADRFWFERPFVEEFYDGSIGLYHCCTKLMGGSGLIEFGGVQVL